MLYVISAIVTSTSGESDQQPFLSVVYPCSSSSWVPGVIDSKWDVFSMQRRLRLRRETKCDG